MNTFHLQIVTPDGLMYDGQAQKIVVRTTEGDVCILSGHADYVTPAAAGQSRVTDENGTEKTAWCQGGLLSVKKGLTRLAADEFEWKMQTKPDRFS
ncbi:MAG: F0F1 ATP synthase subunit epsilon [Oscillospiraceae bacterium]|nr:F0F1 ATP synthase subunit epsilon [Oscillospiraceae bacterium]